MATTRCREQFLRNCEYDMRLSPASHESLSLRLMRLLGVFGAAVILLI
jgi:hypothetical protein